MMQKQPERPTFAEQYKLKELETYYALVIAQDQTLQTAWKHILSSLGMIETRCYTFEQAMDIFKEEKPRDDGPTLLVIDVDLEIIDPLGPQPTTSDIALDALQRWFPYPVSALPALCIRDRRSHSSENGSHHRHPLNATVARSAVLYKPFKNSSLIHALQDQLVNDSTSDETIVTDQQQNQHFTQSHILQENTLSQRPLSEYLVKVKTLLVDDNPINRKVVSRMLSKLNVQPLIAQNGREAYDLVINSAAQGQPIDLILMDVWMPELNGLEATRMIRETPDTLIGKQPYIIAMTACVMPGDREQCFDAGMNAYISKPIQKDELETTIHTFTQIIPIS